MSEVAPPQPMSDAARLAEQRRRARYMAEQIASKYMRELITPEGAALHLKIATFFERAAAFLIDFTVQWLIVFGVILVLSISLSGFGFAGWQIAGAFVSVFIFIFRNFWFIFFEMGRRAATPGKRACGLRVAMRDGSALKADAVLARNFMREIEVGLPLSFLFMGGDELSGAIALFGLLWAGVFLLFPLFNKDKLRVGDLIAGTWVIHAPKNTLKADVSSAVDETRKAQFAFTPAQVDAYGIHELHVLEDVLRQSTSEVRSDVAGRIRRKIDWTRQPGESDTVFLEAYYAALRRRLEQRMLLGERKEDKYDTR